MAGRTEHVGRLAAELNTRGLAPMVLHGSISPAKRRAILKQLADWDPVHPREPLLLAATASYIGEGFDCPALDTLFLCSPSSSESIITQNVGRIMRDLPGKTTVEVHDYADTRVPMLTRMHGKRLTAYKKIGFTNPVIGQIPLFHGTEMAAPAPASPSGTRCRHGSASQGMGEGNGLDVPARGRLRPEVWEQYRLAHLP
ncbi:MAG TPA: helicase-related protein [Streptosporangiaceae bacterium]|nr:helicase-related protein [Streptosporangiaceae bacterium]